MLRDCLSPPRKRGHARQLDLPQRGQPGQPAHDRIEQRSEYLGMCSFKGKPEFIISAAIVLIEGGAVQNQSPTEKIMSGNQVVDTVDDDRTAALESRQLIVRAQG